MIVGVPKETLPGERRIALTPAVVKPLADAGMEVCIEAGAGEEASFPDRLFVEKGARIAGSRADLFAESDIVTHVWALGANLQEGRPDLDLVRDGQVVVGFCHPLSGCSAAMQMADRGVSLFSLELMPRITRAQSMDALSSMSTISGYKAVILAASASPRLFPLLMTAAGTLPAARVFVVGAGVAGLQAIASARRLGAIVEAYDVRPVAREQVESLGAKFVELELSSDSSEDKGGYAKELGEEFYRKQREMMLKTVRTSDVVITTAAVPGKRAPILITHEMVDAMSPGSVIVDLGAERGGNCELTRPGDTVVHGDVTILGPIIVPATVPHHASLMYSRNVAAFLQHLVADGELVLDREDEIIGSTLVAHGGEVVHPWVRKMLDQPTAEGSVA